MRLGRLICRTLAIVIASAALVDPVFSVSRNLATPITPVDLTSAGVVDHRVPCDPVAPCVVYADGSRDADIPPDLQQPLSLVRVGDDASPNIAMRSVSVSPAPHVNAAGALRVTVEGRGVAGQRTEIQVRDGSIVAGSGAIEWTADGTQSTDIAWWPIASGARALRVDARTVPDEVLASDNVVDIGTVVSDMPFPVLFFDARPSWNSTFVRRALEDDPRFLVEYRSRVAPAISAGTTNGRLDEAALNTASVLIVGAPDALTGADVDLAERFVRLRGGTLILLPERAPAGPALSLFTGRWAEELTGQPRSVGPLRASELLRPQEIRPLATAIAPEIIATPAGEGRFIVSGAMDAWRHRDIDAGVFDTFWRSLAAESAVQGQRLRVEFEDAIARPGARHSLVVRYRRMTTEAAISASGVVRCDAGPAQTVRLWPAGAPGTFRGEIPVADARACSVEATVNDSHAAAAVAVAAAPARIRESVLDKFARAAHASGGVVTGEDNLEPIRALNGSPRPTEVPLHPMQSPAWIVPFASLLSIEWWLRRRAGLR